VSDKHSFNSYIRNNRTFNSFIKNVRSFNSYIRNKHSFNLIVEGFQTIFSWRIKFIIPNHVTTVASKIKLLQKIRSLIILNPVIISINTISLKLIQKLNININIKTINIFIPIMKMYQKIVGTEIIIPQKMEFILKFKEKIFGTEILVPSILFEADIHSRKYYILFYWDSYLLSDLDSMLLSDMDYVVV
jgi:hypothetical protein